MFLCELVCSDSECELTAEAVGGPAELELLVCEDCGCCLQVVSVSEWEPLRARARIELARAA